MSKITTSRTSFVLASTFGLGLAFVAGAAWADGDKLDEARQNTAKAISLLQGVEGAKGDAHRKKAIDLLTRAQGEILKAKGE
ncbi:MAG TPA: hypothetical protein VFZ53_26005 [Polyangiaceae bacterium]